MRRIDDPHVVAAEYGSLERLARRRLDATGWLRFGAADELMGVLRAIAEVRPRRVLDAGCGTAWLASAVAAPEVVCVDRSAAAVEAARARGLEARVADIEDLPFDDGAFDVVMCNHVLYHLADRERGLRELARVLRPGGRFVGIYNFRDHLREVWDAVGRVWDDQPDFDCETGAVELARQFARVECRATTGSVVWLTRADLQEYLDAYVELVGELTAPAGPYPFVARRRNCVLVADKAA
jgi:SAM-dependent methyltransferase